MIESYTYKGLWWLPSQDRDEEGRSGDLRIERGRVELELIGHFGHEVLSRDDEGREVSLSFGLGEHPRIVGLTTNGEDVTLEGHVSAYPTISFPGIETGHYSRQTALIGRRYDETEEILFDEIAVRVSDLEIWTRITGLHVSTGGEVDEETERFKASRLDLHYEVPDTFEIPLDNGEHARITFRAPSSGYGGETRSFNIREEATFHLRFEQPHTLAAVKGRVREIRDFFTLAVGRPVTVLSVVGTNSSCTDEDEEPIRVQLLWQIPNNNDPPEQPLRPDELLFSLREAHPSLPAVLSKWFEFQKQFRPVFNLFFGVRYQASIFRDVQFLLWAQAIETYDFRRRDPCELSKADHKRRLKSILDAAPKEWRSWLRMRLTSSNYWTLDQRLRAVLGECPKVSGKIVGASDRELRAFLARFKNTRNYRTHYTPALKDKAAHGVDQYLLIVQMQAIIEMSILRELGFPCDLIDKLFERMRRYDEIAHFRVLSGGAPI